MECNNIEPVSMADFLHYLKSKYSNATSTKLAKQAELLGIIINDSTFRRWSQGVLPQERLIKEFGTVISSYYPDEVVLYEKIANRIRQTKFMPQKATAYQQYIVKQNAKEIKKIGKRNIQGMP